MKKNKKYKKVSRKSPKRKSQEIVIKVQAVPATITPKDLEPIKDGGKYMIPKTWMSEKQVLRLVQKTPPQHIYTRPAKGGGTWKYVTGNYVEKVLNYTFGWAWDFTVKSHGREGDMVWVLGELKVKDDRGHEIIKSQFGRADIKFKKGTQSMLDYGNDLKSATTDSLKKCASLLGIASDVYGKVEIKQETGGEVADMTQLPSPSQTKPISDHSPSQPIQKGQVLGPDGKPTWVCSKCGDPITDQIHDYSVRMYGQPLCREHQQEANSKIK